MTPLNKTLLKLLGIVAMLVTVFYVTQSIVEQKAGIRAREAERQREYFRGQFEAKAAELAKLQALYGTLKAQSDLSGQAATEGRKVARATPVPAKVAPAPESDPTLTKDLIDMGWKAGLVVHADPFRGSLVAHSDAQLAWTWGQEAARVPGLVLRIQRDAEAFVLDEKAIEDCKQANLQAEKVIQGKDEQLAIEGKRREASDAMVAAVVKGQKASERKGYIKAVLAFLAGVAVDKISHK